MDKPKMKCICSHPDAGECIRARTCPADPLDDDFEDHLFTDEQCECSCHVSDEEGRDDWDRYFDALRAYKQAKDSTFTIVRAEADSRGITEGSVVRIAVGETEVYATAKIVENESELESAE